MVAQKLNYRQKRQQGAHHEDHGHKASQLEINKNPASPVLTHHGFTPCIHPSWGSRPVLTHRGVHAQYLPIVEFTPSTHPSWVHTQYSPIMGSHPVLTHRGLTPSTHPSWGSCPWDAPMGGPCIMIMHVLIHHGFTPSTDTSRVHTQHSHIMGSHPVLTYHGFTPSTHPSWGSCP